jgi:hypothetical protein
MRKLLHLVFAVWKTNQPFDAHHFPWEAPRDTPLSPPATANATTPAASTAKEKAVGHKRDVPAEAVVTTASASVGPTSPPVNPPPATPTARPRVDFAFLREQITLEQVLRHLGLFEDLKGHAPQLHGRCPLHEGDRRSRTLSVHVEKSVFHCFHADCQAQGNALDFWAAYHHLPVYEAAVHLAETFHLPRNREEASVNCFPRAWRKKASTAAVITTDGP